jgi:hypothetical protein
VHFVHRLHTYILCTEYTRAFCAPSTHVHFVHRVQTCILCTEYTRAFCSHVFTTVYTRAFCVWHIQVLNTATCKIIETFQHFNGFQRLLVLLYYSSPCESCFIYFANRSRTMRKTNLTFTITFYASHPTLPINHHSIQISRSTCPPTQLPTHRQDHTWQSVPRSHLRPEKAEGQHRSV